MIIYGAGGHARVIISCLLANHQPIQAIFDDDLTKSQILDLPIQGAYHTSSFPDEELVIAIGNNVVRQSLSQKISHSFGTICHPSAMVEKDASIAPGTVVLHGAIIQSGCIIGKHVIINTAAQIDHDCTIANFAHIAPGVILCGNVSVGENTLIGAGSIVVPNIHIGKNCMVAAGSVVTKDMRDGQMVRGNPARIIKTKIWHSPIKFGYPLHT